MNAVVDAYVESPAMKVDWVGRQSVVAKLRQWVRTSFVPAARSGLRALSDVGDDAKDATTSNETMEWENAAIERLARLRMRNLFSYIQAWDHSIGAILDLKEFIRTPESKVVLARNFTRQLNHRLLHAGATTSELLGIYISVISAFKMLDPRGVLLDKVASPLRAYLRQREDSVRVIAASFLADVDDNGNVVNPSDDLCKELCREIALSEGEDLHKHDAGLDWDDMEWTPDPIDAGPDYKKSKSEDIISFMLSLFEQADFIKEVQAMLGERLLTAGPGSSELEKEIRLVELFRGRFGADKLQACEVMLRDMLDSTRINNTLRPTDSAGFPTVHDVHEAIPEEGISVHGLIKKFQPRLPRTSIANQEFIKIMKEAAISDRRSQLLIARPDLPPREAAASADTQPQFSTKIISSFFWPELREDTFEVPEPIAMLQQSFAQGFEGIKNLRKLHWLSALGRATVELELEDRTVKIEGVHTWQASVIYAFNNNNQEGAEEGENAARTVDQLVDALSMDELLVRNAVTFWSGHRVLIESEPDTYVVLERLPSAAEDSAAAAAPQTLAPPPQDAAMSAVKSQDAVLQDNKEMYQLFMIGMLTNGGAMDPARVTMMMKMVCPGGFAFGEDETKWLLADLVEQDKAVNNGGLYSGAGDELEDGEVEEAVTGLIGVLPDELLLLPLGAELELEELLVSAEIELVGSEDAADVEVEVETGTVVGLLSVLLTKVGMLLEEDTVYTISVPVLMLVEIAVDEVLGVETDEEELTEAVTGEIGVLPALVLVLELKLELKPVLEPISSVHVSGDVLETEAVTGEIGVEDEIVVYEVLEGVVDEELLVTDAVTGEMGVELGDKEELLPVPYGTGETGEEDEFDMNKDVVSETVSVMTVWVVYRVVEFEFVSTNDEDGEEGADELLLIDAVTGDIGVDDCHVLRNIDGEDDDVSLYVPTGPEYSEAVPKLAMELVFVAEEIGPDTVVPLKEEEPPPVLLSVGRDKVYGTGYAVPVDPSITLLLLYKE
ncbi:hypothetical protein MBLNU459_g2031t1 [Dothideomycetes sp. NU459]